MYVQVNKKMLSERKCSERKKQGDGAQRKPGEVEKSRFRQDCQRGALWGGDTEQSPNDKLESPTTNGF